MGKKKKKVPKINEQEYNAYIASISSSAAAYGTDGEIFVPDSLKKEEKEKDY